MIHEGIIDEKMMRICKRDASTITDTYRTSNDAVINNISNVCNSKRNNLEM